MLPAKPLIVTAKLDAVSFNFFDELRRLHFPPERNFLSAHITLFHNLPGAEILNIETDLQNIASLNDAIKLDFFGVRFLGRGTAIEIDAPELLSVRAKLAGKWEKYLNAQDRQKFKPHITVQNKMEPKAAKILYENLTAEWTKREGKVVGLQLWHYLGAPWELAGEYYFSE